MKHFALLPICLLLLAFAPATAQNAIQLTVKANGCTQPPTLYTFNGASFEEVAALEQKEDGTYTVDLTGDEPIFRYVGSSMRDALPVLLAPGEATTVTGQCGRLRNATITGSALNDRYGELKQEYQRLNGELSGALRSLQRAGAAGDQPKIDEELVKLAQVDSARAVMVAENRAAAPILGRIAALNGYTSYQHGNANEKYQNELDYFLNEYFAAVDYTDPGYNDLPWTYEANRNFTNILASAIGDEQLTPILLQTFERWPGGSRAQLLAMSGGFAALAQKKHPTAVPLAETIVDRFKLVYPKPVAEIAKQALGLRTFSVGAEAPLFTAETPEGESLALESLRGKIVLLDFWASWCGPCRKENPNVVKVYEKYREQGFEILGISLDRTKAAWLGAIEKDGLEWLHVSDLKGWKSEYSNLYGVRSIPHTVLLDREGKIIARNLRGPALEAKLAEVFSAR